MSTFETFVDNLPSVSSASNLTKEKQKELYKTLVELRKKWCKSSVNPTAYLLVRDEVCTRLTNGAIEYIVNNIHKITSEEQLLELGIASYSYCQQVHKVHYT